MATPVLKLLGVIDTNMDNGSHSSLFIAASQEFKRTMCGVLQGNKELLPFVMQAAGRKTIGIAAMEGR
jgi:hypothetical protein